MNIRVKAIVLIFSGLCSLGSLNGQIPMGVTHSGQSTSQAPFPLTQYTELKNPAPTDEKSWKGLSGTRCAWGDTYTRYKKEVIHVSIRKRLISKDGKEKESPHSW